MVVASLQVSPWTVGLQLSLSFPTAGASRHPSARGILWRHTWSCWIFPDGFKLEMSRAGNTLVLGNRCPKGLTLFGFWQLGGNPSAECWGKSTCSCCLSDNWSPRGLGGWFPHCCSQCFVPFPPLAAHSMESRTRIGGIPSSVVQEQSSNSTLSDV